MKRLITLLFALAIFATWAYSVGNNRINLYLETKWEENGNWTFESWWTTNTQWGGNEWEENWYISWDIEPFFNAKKLEIILDLDDSALLYNLKIESKSDKKPVVKNENWEYFIKRWICTPKWCWYWPYIRSIEEKIAMKIKNEDWDYIIFTNYDSEKLPSNVKKFHDISLIKDNNQLKAKVIIYVHSDIDKEIARVLLKPQTNYNCCEKLYPWDGWYSEEKAELNLKSIAYIYAWIKKNKVEKKSKLIKINYEWKWESEIDEILKNCNPNWLMCYWEESNQNSSSNSSSGTSSWDSKY